MSIMNALLKDNTRVGMIKDAERAVRQLSSFAGMVDGRQSKDVYLVQRPASERLSLLPDESSHPTEEEAE